MRKVQRARTLRRSSNTSKLTPSHFRVGMQADKLRLDPAFTSTTLSRFADLLWDSKEVAYFAFSMNRI
jgi:hypothetical protein